MNKQFLQKILLYMLCGFCYVHLLLINWFFFFSLIFVFNEYANSHAFIQNIGQHCWGWHYSIACERPKLWKGLFFLQSQKTYMRILHAQSLLCLYSNRLSVLASYANCWIHNSPRVLSLCQSVNVSSLFLIITDVNYHNLFVCSYLNCSTVKILVRETSSKPFSIEYMGSFLVSGLTLENKLTTFS